MPNWRTDSTTGLTWLAPDWPAPIWVQAASTSRIGGFSVAPYASLNLATHVGDEPECIGRNRSRLRHALGLPSEPFWLEQVHGCAVAGLDKPVATEGGAERGAEPECTADAVWTNQVGRVCAVMTADCLPLLLCDQSGREVAAVHAGWRGLCDGVIEAAVTRFSVAPQQMLAWFGPAIGPYAFEVGDEVRAAFLQRDAIAAAAFKPLAPGKWWADLFLLARQRLRALGVERVSGGGLCSFSDPERFFSYRRDGITGRMATLIWIEPGEGEQ